MSHVLVSYSSGDIAHAIALQCWLAENGRQDVFIEMPSESNADSGMTWERALYESGHRCEAVVFLVSKAWLSSETCRQQFRVAERLNKRLFAALIEDLLISDIPTEITDVSEFFSLSFTPDYRDFFVMSPGAEKRTLVRFSAEGLRQLEFALKLTSLEAESFQWPPLDEPARPAQRGRQSFEEKDAGIFFGREDQIGKALELLRGLRKGPSPRVMVIRGVEGAGKSSFLRAGLIPRLRRDERNFWTLPVIRPSNAAVSGETGLIASVESAIHAWRLDRTPDEPRRALQNGSFAFRRLLDEFVGKQMARRVESKWPYPAHVNAPRGSPMLVLCIDQAEELFTTSGRDEAETLLALLRDLIIEDCSTVAAILAIRSGLYPDLQEAELLNGIEMMLLDLESLPKASHTTSTSS